jgi:RHS repeat-associated protein
LSYTNDRLLGLQVIEENNYYPFGLKHNGYNNISPPNSVYKYKYNGKEFQDELGLNWTSMDFRNYDNALGRFLSMDRLAELAYSITPYRFAYNNPVYWSDPTGLMEGGVGNLSALGADITGVKTVFFGDLGKKQGKNKEKDATSTGLPAATTDSPVYDYHDFNPESVLLPEVPIELVRNTKAFQNFVYANSPFYAYMFGSNRFFMSESYNLWGPNRYGDLMGNKNGRAKYSIDVSQIPTGFGKPRNATGSKGFGEWLFSWIKNKIDLISRIQTIQAITQNANTSTMEIQNIPVTVPTKVSDTIYLINKYYEGSNHIYTPVGHQKRDSILNAVQGETQQNEVLKILKYD